MRIKVQTIENPDLEALSESIETFREQGWQLRKTTKSMDRDTFQALMIKEEDIPIEELNEDLRKLENE